MSAQHKRAGATAKRERQQRAKDRLIDPLMAKQRECQKLQQQLAETQGRIVSLISKEDSEPLFPERVRAMRKRLETHAERLELRIIQLKMR